MRILVLLLCTSSILFHSSNNVLQLLTHILLLVTMVSTLLHLIVIAGVANVYVQHDWSLQRDLYRTSVSRKVAYHRAAHRHQIYVRISSILQCNLSLILFPVKDLLVFMADGKFSHCVNQVVLVPHKDTRDMYRLVPFVIPMYCLVSLSSIFVHDPSPIQY